MCPSIVGWKWFWNGFIIVTVCVGGWFTVLVELMYVEQFAVSVYCCGFGNGTVWECLFNGLEMVVCREMNTKSDIKIPSEGHSLIQFVYWWYVSIVWCRDFGFFLFDCFSLKKHFFFFF